MSFRDTEDILKRVRRLYELEDGGDSQEILKQLTELKEGVIDPEYPLSKCFIYCCERRYNRIKELQNKGAE